MDLLKNYQVLSIFLAIWLNSFNEEELTSGWTELDSNLTKDEASTKLSKLIEQGYNPNRLRVRTLLNE